MAFAVALRDWLHDHQITVTPSQRGLTEGVSCAAAIWMLYKKLLGKDGDSGDHYLCP